MRAIGAGSAKGGLRDIRRERTRRRLGVSSRPCSPSNGSSGRRAFLLHALLSKIRDGELLQRKDCYLALGVATDGERATYSGCGSSRPRVRSSWTQVISKFKQRGTRGLKRFGDGMVEIGDQARARWASVRCRCRGGLAVLGCSHTSGVTDHVASRTTSRVRGTREVGLMRSRVRGSCEPLTGPALCRWAASWS